MNQKVLYLIFIIYYSLNLIYSAELIGKEQNNFDIGLITQTNSTSNALLILENIEETSYTQEQTDTFIEFVEEYINTNNERVQSISNFIYREKNQISSNIISSNSIQGQKPLSLTNSDKMVQKQIIPTPLVKKEKSHKIAVMGEFGLGNVFGIYGGYKINLFNKFDIYPGLGFGYLFYDDDINGTSVNIFEPSIMIMTEYKMIIGRIRAGYDYVSEETYGFSESAFTISPDIMIQYKGIYTGISLPITTGKEGTSMAFAIGVGYRYIIKF